MGGILIFGLVLILLDDISVILHSSISLLLQIISLRPALLLAPHWTQPRARFGLVESLAEGAIGLLGRISWPRRVAFGELEGMLLVSELLPGLLAVAGPEGGAGRGGGEGGLVDGTGGRQHLKGLAKGVVDGGAAVGLDGVGVPERPWVVGNVLDDIQVFIVPVVGGHGGAHFGVGGGWGVGRVRFVEGEIDGGLYLLGLVQKLLIAWSSNHRWIIE